MHFTSCGKLRHTAAKQILFLIKNLKDAELCVLAQNFSLTHIFKGTSKEFHAMVKCSNLLMFFSHYQAGEAAQQQCGFGNPFTRSGPAPEEAPERTKLRLLSFTNTRSQLWALFPVWNAVPRGP